MPINYDIEYPKLERKLSITQLKLNAVQAELQNSESIRQSQIRYIQRLQKAITDIAPWLSASLEGHEHDGENVYGKACEQIFMLDVGNATPNALELHREGEELLTAYEEKCDALLKYAKKEHADAMAAVIHELKVLSEKVKIWRKEHHVHCRWYCGPGCTKEPY